MLSCANLVLYSPDPAKTTLDRTSPHIQTGSPEVSAKPILVTGAIGPEARLCLATTFPR